MIIVRMTWIVAVLVLLSSCSILPSRVDISSEGGGEEELVATDFVNAMARLQGFRPMETTVQFHEPTTRFKKALHNVMRTKGYGIQITPEGVQGPNQIDYKVQKYETENETSLAYEVSVGHVRLSREYEVRAENVFPITALAVNGPKTIDNYLLDNTSFNKPIDVWTEVPTSNLVNPVDAWTEVPSVSPKKTAVEIREKPRSIKDRLPEMSTNSAKSIIPLRMFINGPSVVDSMTLVFENDSMVLGEHNKKLIDYFITNFDEESNIVSLMGCSNGPTSIPNGNAVLALGRASRIKEALMRRGVSPDHITTDGCWSPENDAEWPNRAVIMSLRTTDTLT